MMMRFAAAFNALISTYALVVVVGFMILIQCVQFRDASAVNAGFMLGLFLPFLVRTVIADWKAFRATKKPEESHAEIK